jgi:hypothetical protein
MWVPSKRLLALCVALAAGVLAAVALGQEIAPLGTTVAVTPSDAGTPHHPQGIRIDAHGTGDPQGQGGQTMPSSIDVWLPKGWRYNGAKYPVCVRAKLIRGGPEACPAPSIMGRGELGYVEDRPSTTPPNMIVFNGGGTKMYFWVVLVNPARVQNAVTGTITKLRSSRWSYRLHAHVPASLQVVAGLPSSFALVSARIGRSDWLATTSCPHDRRWRYRLRLTTLGQTSDLAGSIPCQP